MPSYVPNRGIYGEEQVADNMNQQIFPPGKSTLVVIRELRLHNVSSLASMPGTGNSMLQQQLIGLIKIMLITFIIIINSSSLGKRKL